MSVQRFTLFTEAVKGGLGGTKHAFHTHLSVWDYDTGRRRTIPLQSLKDLKDHRHILSDPNMGAELHVGIGDRFTREKADQDVARHGYSHPEDFHTHVRLKKEPGSTTFTPKFMHTKDKEQRKGWGTTLWNHLDRKLKAANLNLDHDWSNQTSDGHAWSRKTSGRGREREVAADNFKGNDELTGWVDPKSEWHMMTPAQRTAFRSYTDPLLTKGTGEFGDPKARSAKGMFGDPEIAAVRKQMRTKHGVKLHPYTVANAMHHISGTGYYKSGYTGTIPMPQLRDLFTNRNQFFVKKKVKQKELVK